VIAARGRSPSGASTVARFSRSCCTVDARRRPRRAATHATRRRPAAATRTAPASGTRRATGTPGARSPRRPPARRRRRCAAVGPSPLVSHHVLQHRHRRHARWQQWQPSSAYCSLCPFDNVRRRVCTT
jgi:hypothetical protein